jgi:plasmid stabilization system protein ParE
LNSFRLSKPARDDLRNILSYIAPRNPSAARALYRRLLKDFRLIASHPGLGSMRRNAKYRILSCQNILIVYQGNRPMVEIIRLIDGRRDVEALLEDQDAFD